MINIPDQLNPAFFSVILDFNYDKSSYKYGPFLSVNSSIVYLCKFYNIEIDWVL